MFGKHTLSGVYKTDNSKQLTGNTMTYRTHGEKILPVKYKGCPD